MAWLHWIGKSYYTIGSFITESEQYGITRRVALNVLERMNWGDKVLCIQKEDGAKSGSIFLEFNIERLSGLSAEAEKALAKRWSIVMIDPGGDRVERECGEYETGPLCAFEGATLPEIARILKSLKTSGVDIGKPMIGCSKGYFSVYNEPLTRLRDVPFRPGFRTFDYTKFLSAVAEKRVKNPKRRVVLTNAQFYGDISNSARKYGETQTVSEYKKA